MNKAAIYLPPEAYYDHIVALPEGPKKAKAELKPAEIKKIKAIAKELLKVQEERRVLAERWRDTAASLAQLETTILDHFWENIPEGTYKEGDIANLAKRDYQYVVAQMSETVH